MNKTHLAKPTNRPLENPKLPKSRHKKTSRIGSLYKNLFKEEPLQSASEQRRNWNLELIQISKKWVSYIVNITDSQLDKPWTKTRNRERRMHTPTSHSLPNRRPQWLTLGTTKAGWLAAAVAILLELQNTILYFSNNQRCLQMLGLPQNSSNPPRKHRNRKGRQSKQRQKWFAHRPKGQRFHPHPHPQCIQNFHPI